MYFRSVLLLLATLLPLSMSWGFGLTRRSVMKEVVATSAGITLTTSLPRPSSAAVPSSEIEGAKTEIVNLIKSDPNKGPTLIRLAWHSSGTYSKLSKDGGPSGGTIRFKDELLHGGNAGLAVTAVPWMGKIHSKHPQISYADLYTLGGAVAVETLGGPKIPWRQGRNDAGEDSITPDGRLPNADVGPAGADKSDAQHLRDIFYRMGFDDKGIVALSGAHALGRCHTTASGYDGPWSPTPTTFNNSYFTLLSSVNWTPREWNGPFQYENGKGGTLMMLPSDIALIEDPKFKKWVDVYAQDSDRFFGDFSDSFSKLMELGCNNLA